MRITEHDRRVLTFAGGGWPATFSCNPDGEVWPFVTWGWTPEQLRRHLNLSALDEIVDNVLAARPEGGRFHVSDRGVQLAVDGRMVISFEPLEVDLGAVKVGGEIGRAWARSNATVHELNETRAQLIGILGGRQGAIVISETHSLWPWLQTYRDSLEDLGYSVLEGPEEMTFTGVPLILGVFLGAHQEFLAEVE